MDNSTIIIFAAVAAVLVAVVYMAPPSGQQVTLTGVFFPVGGDVTLRVPTNTEPVSYVFHYLTENGTIITDLEKTYPPDNVIPQQGDTCTIQGLKTIHYNDDGSVNQITVEVESLVIIEPAQP